MLNKLQPRKLAEIRSKFGGHPLFAVINNACCDCCAIPKIFQFRPEHVFIEVVTLVDVLKENQQEINWSKLYSQTKQDYLYMDSDIPNDELDCIAAIVCTTLASLLVMSLPRFYHETGEMLLQQVFAHDNKIPRDELYALCDDIEKYEPQLQSWMEEYMQSDEFLSIAFEELYADTVMSTEQGKPTHIRFVEGVSVVLRQECLDSLRNAINSKKNWGKAATIKNLLLFYKNEDVIILDGTEIDIYNDLYTFWGYRQSDKTFYAAKPKLGRN